MNDKERFADKLSESVNTSLRVEGLETRNLLATDLDDTLIESRDLGVVSEQDNTVAAEISEATDVDMYRMTLNEGQTVDIDVDTIANGPSGLGGYLRVFNDQGIEIASNNDGTAPGDTSGGFDPYLRFTAPQGGQYFVSISNWQNTGFDPLSGEGDRVGDQYLTGAYQLSVRSLPLTDNDDSMSEAMAIGGAGPVGYSVNGQIDPDVALAAGRSSYVNAEGTEVGDAARREYIFRRGASGYGPLRYGTGIANDTCCVFFFQTIAR